MDQYNKYGYHTKIVLNIMLMYKFVAVVGEEGGGGGAVALVVVVAAVK